MNSHGAIQCPAVDDPLKEESDGAGEIAALRLELEKARCELDRRQERLAQMDGLFAHNVTLELRANSELEKALDDRKRAEALLEREKKLLEMIARGQSLAEIFEGLCRVVEEVSGDALAAIMVLDPDGRRLRNGSAPSFPEGFIAAVDGVEIGPAVGSCGTAAYRKEQVIVCDIATDPLWANYRELAFAYGLRAGWSTPILDSDGGVLGTFAIYWREPRSPDRQHFQIINQITHLAAVAIERKRAAEALVASERLARGQAEALTGALDRLTRESDPDRIVEHVLRTVTAQSGAHSSSVWLRDESTGLMAFEFALEDGKFKTKSDGALAAVSPKLPVEAVWPWPEVFRTRKPCLLEDIRTGPDFPWRAHVLAQGIVTILVVPMVIAGDVQGVVGIRFTHKRSFRVEEMELPQALANQAMLAVQLARLSAHSRQSAIIAERNRMARDVHDALAHGFTGVILHLEAAEEAMSRERAGVVSSHLRSAGEIARDGLREARRSVQALRPLALEEKSLGEAFKELVNKMTAGTTVQANVSFQGQVRELPPEWEANLLRVGQEVLTNVLRHAGASQFDAQLAYDDLEVRLRLQDNGRGFDPAKSFRGALFATQAALKHMQDGGRIIMIGSCVGERNMTPGLAAYAATKGAIKMFVQGLSREVGGRGITINNVQPGPIDTDLNPAAGDWATPQIANTALKRYGHVDDIAAMVAFVAGPEASYITGVSLPVDGGSKL